MGVRAVPRQTAAAGRLIVRGCPQQAPLAPKNPIGYANQPPHASVSDLVDTSSVCCRDDARNETSLAGIYEAEKKKK